MATNNKYKPCKVDRDALTHAQHVTAHIAASRQWGKGSTDKQWKALYSAFRSPFSVEDWLTCSSISEEDCTDFPNAKLAAKIKNSPLWKALS